MSRYFLVILAGLICAFAVPAQEEIQGKVRAGIDIEPPLWVGQGARLSIEMLTTGVIFSNQDYAIPDVSGALVLQSSGNALNITEQENGTSWQGLRYQIRIYPQRAGEFIVPPMQVSFSVSAGFGQAEQDFSFQTEEIRFDAQRPPGANASSPIVTTSSLEVSQTWDPEPVDLLVGHAVKRIVNLQAEDIPGMVLPPMPSLEIDGIGVYPSDPRVNSVADRGRFSGERTDQLDIVFEQAGHYEIPGYTIQWWQPDREDLTVLEVAGLVIDVAPNPALENTAAEQIQNRGNIWQIGWLLLLALLLGIVGWKSSPAITDWLDQWRRRRDDSERAHFRRFAKACSGTNPGLAYLLLDRWQKRANISKTQLNAGVEHELRIMQEAMASGDNKWNGHALLREYSELRKSHFNVQQQKQVVLAPLNPGPN